MSTYRRRSLETPSGDDQELKEEMRLMSKVSDILRGRNSWRAPLWLSVCGCLLFSLISISVVQIFLCLGLIATVFFLFRRKLKPCVPSFFWPLLVYAGLTLLSSFFSLDPGTSFLDSRELLLFLVVPLACTAFSSIEEVRISTGALFFSGVVSSLYALAFFILRGHWGDRVMGFMGHYMTQAGLLMLFCGTALAMTFFLRTRARWLWAAGWALGLAALTLTLTRSSWVGLVLAACFLLFLLKPKATAVVPLVLVLFYFAAPQAVKQRALSIFSVQSFSNQQRIEYARAGLQIIREHPLWGTGPDTAEVVFQHPRFGLSEASRRNVHLHSNIIQIAAERGLPALAAWLAFMAWTFVSLLKLLKGSRSLSRALSASGLAAVIGLFFAGFFEYNFADSEITVLFLLLISLPFALKGTPTDEAASPAEKK